jgi:ABC-2 type transport system permease protein
MMITNLLEQILGSHLFALVTKETKEILRNKHLLFLLLVPPILQLLILGAAIDPQVRNLRLGLVDYAQTQESRDLITSLIGSTLFPRVTYLPSQKALGDQLQMGKLNVGLVIPPTFTNELNRHISPQVQVLVDGADAYSAGIASSYTLRILSHFSPRLLQSDLSRAPKSSIVSQEVMLYNPGWLSSWFFVPGVLGATLTLTATLVASATILRERESGTMEQLLMTPAANWQIVLAKVIPLVVFLLIDVMLAISMAKVVFQLPFRGSIWLFMLASMLYIFVGIGFGMLLGTICKSQRQAQLASFFINIPLIQLSGTVVPFDTMPQFLQSIAMFDPLRYYAIIARSIILKGMGLDVLWSYFLLLAFFSVLVLAVSTSRFNRQLM